jgi:uncharacterized protein
MLVDSNLLVYAIDSSSPNNEAAQEFLASNLPKLVIADQNILEALRVLTHSKYKNAMTVLDAQSALDSIISNLRVIRPTGLTYEIAKGLIKKYGLSGNQIFDAYLAATALSNSVSKIATNNVKDFARFSEIEVVSVCYN